MFVNCEVILRGDVTPEQQKALGIALWPWFHRAAGAAEICRDFDNQALTRLVRFTEPLTQYAGLPRLQFVVWDDPACDRESMLESLRRALPRGGIADVRVDGISWRPAETTGRTTTAVWI